MLSTIYSDACSKRMIERIERINNGEINGTDACIQLLDSVLQEEVNFSEWSLSDTENQEAKDVLKTFNDLHRSWFTNIDFPVENNSFMTEDFLIPGEGAYYYTRSLFADDVPYQGVLMGNIVLGGKRHSGNGQLNDDNDHTGHLGIT